MIYREGMFAIELSRRPCCRAMAGSAVCSKLTCMFSRLRMAANTFGRYACKLSIGMTTLTFHAGMTTRQREVRAVVIEIHIVPLEGVVACAAVRAKLTVVHIIVLMAGVAVGGSSLKHVVDMA